MKLWHMLCLEYQNKLLKGAIDKRLREKIMKKREYHKGKLYQAPS